MKQHHHILLGTGIVTMGVVLLSTPVPIPIITCGVVCALFYWSLCIKVKRK